MAFPHPFYFLRHGETTWNAMRKTQGQQDSLLSDLGRAQAERAGEVYASEKIDRIVASPLSRARHTAEAVAKHHDVEIIFDDGLMECHLGDMECQPNGPWLVDYWMGNFDPPNGETFGQFSARVWSAMRRAVDMGPNTLIVAHGGLWTAAHEFVRIEPGLRPMPNALPLHVTPENKVWRHRILDEDRLDGLTQPPGASV